MISVGLSMSDEGVAFVSLGHDGVPDGLGWRPWKPPSDEHFELDAMATGANLAALLRRADAGGLVACWPEGQLSALATAICSSVSAAAGAAGAFLARGKPGGVMPWMCRRGALMSEEKAAVAIGQFQANSAFSEFAAYVRSAPTPWRQLLVEAALTAGLVRGQVLQASSGLHRPPAVAGPSTLN